MAWPRLRLPVRGSFGQLMVWKVKEAVEKQKQLDCKSYLTGKEQSNPSDCSKRSDGFALVYEIA
jgi:hypothetical protein